MTDMQKTIEELKVKGVEYKIDKNPYGGHYVKYPAEKFCGHKFIYWASFRENGTAVRKQSHVNSI